MLAVVVAVVAGCLLNDYVENQFSIKLSFSIFLMLTLPFRWFLGDHFAVIPLPHGQLSMRQSLKVMSFWAD